MRGSKHNRVRAARRGVRARGAGRHAALRVSVGIMAGRRRRLEGNEISRNRASRAAEHEQPTDPPTQTHTDTHRHTQTHTDTHTHTHTFKSSFSSMSCASRVVRPTDRAAIVSSACTTVSNPSSSANSQEREAWNTMSLCETMKVNTEHMCLASTGRTNKTHDRSRRRQQSRATVLSARRERE
jgi:hypothetical protein